MWPKAVLEVQGRVESYLGRAQAAEAVLYRAEQAGTEAAAAEARRWSRRVLTMQAPNGTWGGSDLAATAAALITLDELRQAGALREIDPGVGKALDWLRSRQNQPGRYGAGCSAARHARGLCHHFLGGFFSPAPAEAEVAPLTLRCGATLPDEAGSRLAASSLALRAMLAWGRVGPDISLHIDGLRRVLGAGRDGPGDALTDPGSPLSPGAVLAGLAALIDVPEAGETRRVISGVLEELVSRQRGDGSWQAIDVFQALDVLESARAAGWDAVEPAIRRAGELLASTLGEGGSWRGDAPARTALIGWRALRLLSDPGPDRPG